MNKIEKLHKKIESSGVTYCPRVYLNAWNNWCITYADIINTNNHLCSVIVEPNKDPVKIEDTLDSSINSGIGNARTFDDAIDMISNYVKQYIKK